MVCINVVLEPVFLFFPSVLLSTLPHHVLRGVREPVSIPSVCPQGASWKKAGIVFKLHSCSIALLWLSVSVKVLVQGQLYSRNLTAYLLCTKTCTCCIFCMRGMPITRTKVALVIASKGRKRLALNWSACFGEHRMATGCCTVKQPKTKTYQDFMNKSLRLFCKDS